MFCSLLQFLKDAWDGFSLAIIVFIVSIALNTCVIVNAYIPSESMSYTINLGDRIIGNRLSYRDGHQPERYDIIIFHAPDKPGVLYIKRVIGLPGDIASGGTSGGASGSVTETQPSSIRSRSSASFWARTTMSCSFFIFTMAISRSRSFPR